MIREAEIVVNSSSAPENTSAYCKSLESSLLIGIDERLKSNSGESRAVNEAIKRLMGLSSEEKLYEYDLNSMMKLGLGKSSEGFRNMFCFMRFCEKRAYPPKTRILIILIILEILGGKLL